MGSTTIGQLFGTKQENDKDNFLVVKNTAVMGIFFGGVCVIFLILSCGDTSTDRCLL